MKKSRTVTFSAAIDPRKEIKSKSGRYILRKVPVAFRAGVYPDRKFKMSSQELKRAVENFSGPIAADSEHRKSVFDGQLGSLVGLEMSDKKTASAYVAVPTWFDAVVPVDKQAISLSFDRKTKDVVGMGWTHNPRIPEAKLEAAFSHDQAENGELVSFSNEDEVAAEFSLTPEGKKKEPEPAPKAKLIEKTKIDFSMEDPDPMPTPAAPNADPDKDSSLSMLHGKALFAAINKLAKQGLDDCDPEIHSKQYATKLKKIVELSVISDEPSETEEEDEEAEGKDDAAKSKKKKKKKAAFSANPIDPRVKALLRDRRSRIASEAASFADELIRTHRVLPRKKNAVIRAYVSASEEDVVNFSGSDEHLNAFKEKLLARKKISMFQELLNDQEKSVMTQPQFQESVINFSSDDEAPESTISEARRRQILSHSQAGRQVLESAQARN